MADNMELDDLMEIVTLEDEEGNAARLRNGQWWESHICC